MDYWIVSERKENFIESKQSKGGKRELSNLWTRKIKSELFEVRELMGDEVTVE